jgi:uncharacterized protein involved in type VI secretion and phage assembly
MAQLWAGKGWGAVFTPRVGHEVINRFFWKAIRIG